MPVVCVFYAHILFSGKTENGTVVRVHNSVGSALLVPIGWALPEPQKVGRAAGIVPTLFFVLICYYSVWEQQI